MIFLHHSSLLKKHKAGFFASLQTLQRDQQKQRVCSSERPNEFFAKLLFSSTSPLLHQESIDEMQNRSFFSFVAARGQPKDTPAKTSVFNRNYVYV